MSNTYEFDANISVMAGSDSKAKAADKIFEHCLNADIAISLHQEGTLNNGNRGKELRPKGQSKIGE